MKLMSFEKIRETGIDPIECMRWVEEALALKNDAVLPAKTSMKPGEGHKNVFFNCMPCLIPQVGRGGVKLVTRYPERKPSLDSEILLYDTSSGESLALVDGDWITTMRTGAVAAHSARLCGREGFSRVAFMGLGNTARATLLCLNADQNRPMEIGLLAYKSQHELFRARFDEHDNLAFSVFNDVRELCSWADVVVSCVTAAERDFCEPRVFRPGATVIPVHTRGFAQCDLAFDKVLCDDEGHVKGFRYYDCFKDKLVEMSDVLAGESTGRDDEVQRIIAYNIGISLHDIYFASRLYELIGDNCEDITLEGPKEKFWI